MSATQAHVQATIRRAIAPAAKPRKAKPTAPTLPDLNDGESYFWNAEKRCFFNEANRLVPGLPVPAACPFCKKTSFGIWKNDCEGAGVEAAYYSQCGDCSGQGPYECSPLAALMAWNFRAKEMKPKTGALHSQRNRRAQKKHLARLAEEHRTLFFEAAIRKLSDETPPGRSKPLARWIKWINDAWREAASA